MDRILALFVLLVSLPAAGAGEAPHSVVAAGKPLSFTGKVVDAHDRPAADAAVYVSLSPQQAPGADLHPRPTIGRTQSAADGSFHLEMSVPEKEWSATVVAVKVGQGPGGQDVHTAADATGLVIRLTHPSFLAGQVVDQAGRSPERNSTFSIPTGSTESSSTCLQSKYGRRP